MLNEIEKGPIFLSSTANFSRRESERLIFFIGLFLSF